MSLVLTNSSIQYGTQNSSVKMGFQDQRLRLRVKIVTNPLSSATNLTCQSYEHWSNMQKISSTRDF